MRRSARLTILLSLILGCEEVERPEVIWKGKTIRYATDHPEELCGGTLEYLDRRATAMTDRLGGPDLIDYYWVDDVSLFCPDWGDLLGCARGDNAEIYAEDAMLLHEVAHLRGSDSMTAVLEEGIAVHFGDPLPLEVLSPREDFIDELYLAPSRYQGGYSRAGHFAAFVSETYGWETLLEIDDALAPGATPAAVDAAFSSVVGVGLDDVLAIYADYPDCLNIVDNSIACTAELEGEYNFTEVAYERVVDCASATGLGPNGGWAFAEGIIQLPEDIDGARIISMTGDGLTNGGVVFLARCGSCLEGGTLILRDPFSEVADEQLPPGRYLVRFYVPTDAGPVSIRLSIQ